MRGQFVTLTLDPQAGERESFGRLLACVEFAEQDFNATLVNLGFARVYTEGEASREPHYLELESAARSQGKGLWECEGTSAAPLPAASPPSCDPSYPLV